MFKITSVAGENKMETRTHDQRQRAEETDHVRPVGHSKDMDFYSD
jgi:hypothetical protein